ncbi:MAG: 1-deoxy-D-xylulose-5-phosphate reductoisomerase [Planctomycetaceae bacterium]
MTSSTSRRVAILGATGSIGTAAADVMAHLRSVDRAHDWILHGISGHGNLALLATIAQRHLPARIVLSDSSAASAWQMGDQAFADIKFPSGCRIEVGCDRLNDLAADPAVDTVVAAIVGRAGLESTIEAVRAGKRVALANKETLVVAGSVVRDLLKKSGATLLPVDSEHSAIFQCLAGRPTPKRVILTASGGPFRDWTAAQMEAATVDQAMAHPTWRMGTKITIDSATMMNKALEIIEARWLFDLPPEQIDVVIHPQSIIHSMIETIDGSMIAQLSPPDMRLPIQHALTYPDCVPGATATLDLAKNLNLSLLPVDRDRFPAISLGFEVARAGGTAGAVVNAANEEAVGLFLQGQIRFTDIVPACQNALEHHNHEQNASLDRLLELDRWARAEVWRWQARSISSS